MSCKLVNCIHRHCVFTIPEELRPYFLNDRSLLNCLFHSVRDVILRMFFKENKSEAFTPGFILVLHTFGRDLKWNPHIHALISEGGAGNFTVWRPCKHFDYTFLRNAFRKVLLEQLTNKIGKSFRKVKNEMYTKHANGFYVRAKPNLCRPDITIKYISRYLGRPVIATSRIDEYDGEFVTFHYTRHEDHKTITERIPALDFIKRLIVHIPEKHFKMLRYYGIYAKHHKQESKLHKCISSEKRKYLRSLYNWQNMILSNVQNVAKPCLHSKFITKKLHYLNNIERLWDMAEAILIIFSQSSNSANNQTKNFIIKVIAKPPLRSFAMPFSIQQILYTIFCR